MPSPSALATKIACAYCRHLKMRCIRDEVSGHENKCQRCYRLNKECVVESVRRRPGRKRGSKNKKTLSKSDKNPTAEDASSTHSRLDMSPDSVLMPQESHGKAPSPCPPPYKTSMDALSNPLGLLAEVSEAEFQAPNTANGSSMDMSRVHPLSSSLQSKLMTLLHAGDVDPRLSKLNLDHQILLSGLQYLASPDQHSSHDINAYQIHQCRTVRDIGPELDPIECAVLSERESIYLFDIFLKFLHPMIAIIDPHIHTLEFIRSRSAFLFTVVCLNGAQFSPDSEATCKRLHQHAIKLASLIADKRYMSLELVQGFLLWLPWLPASYRHTEDNLWKHTSQALDMAIRLGIDKPFSNISNKNTAKRGNANGKDFLDLSDDMFENIDINNKSLVNRMQRNKERTWLRFFLWETALTAAFGRMSTFAENDLIQNEEWYIHPLACEYDRDTCALVKLRRNFISLANEVKKRLKFTTSMGSDWIKALIDETLDPWYEKWVPNDLAPSTELTTRIYDELIYSHGRVWLLTYALQLAEKHNVDTPELTADCLEAALNASYSAVQHLRAARSIWYMPNSLAPMISFAAVLSLRLFDCLPSFGVVASHSQLLGLLAHLAELLEKVGSTPPHRAGTASIYGRRLSVILKARMVLVLKSHMGQGGSVSQPGSRIASRAVSRVASPKVTTVNLQQQQQQQQQQPCSQLHFNGVNNMPTTTPSLWDLSNHDTGNHVNADTSNLLQHTSVQSGLGSFGGTDSHMGRWNDNVMGIMDMLWPYPGGGIDLGSDQQSINNQHIINNVDDVISYPASNDIAVEGWPDDVRNAVEMFWQDPWTEVVGVTE